MNGDLLDIFIRLALAMVCGGILGMERGKKNRPAGFRTYMIVCLGAALTMLISQHMFYRGYATDLSRLGAQVVSGIGFLGAGTIIVTGRQQIKGLTTAAGLWASACMGLCLGAGFVEGAFVAALIILMVELLFAKFEYFIFSSSRVFNLYVEYTENGKLGKIVDTVKKTGAYIVDLEITKSMEKDKTPCIVISIQAPRRLSHQAIITTIARIDGVLSVEEL